MTSDGKFTSIEDFRVNAKHEDVVELVYLYYDGRTNFPTKEEPKPECRFQFSADEAMQELLRQIDIHTEPSTLEEAAPKEEEPMEKQSLVFATRKQDFRKRSVMMTEDHWNRLQALYDMYPTMNKHYVFQALLEYAFSSLGL